MSLNPFSDRFYSMENAELDAKVIQAQEAYARDCSPDERVVFLYDDTTWGSGKAGFFISEKYIYSKGNPRVRVDQVTTFTHSVTMGIHYIRINGGNELPFMVNRKQMESFVRFVDEVLLKKSGAAADSLAQTMTAVHKATLTPAGKEEAAKKAALLPEVAQCIARVAMERLAAEEALQQTAGARAVAMWCDARSAALAHALTQPANTAERGSADAGPASLVAEPIHYGSMVMATPQSPPMSDTAPMPANVQIHAPIYYWKIIVLPLVIFFAPLGVILLWRSPLTRISGRIAWSVIIGLLWLAAGPVGIGIYLVGMLLAVLLRKPARP